jgi:hypothetical protein
LEVPIEVYNRGTRVIRKVLAKKKVIVSPGATVRVDTTCAALPSGRNYTMNACFNGVHDALTDHGNYVTYTNTTDKSQTIPRRARLGVIRDFEEEGCYIVSHTDEFDDDTTTNALALPRSMKGAGITKPTEVPEKLLGNDVHVCTKDQTLADRIEAIVVEFQNCWEDDGSPIDVPENERMEIPLVDGWQEKKIRCKIYPVGVRDRQVIDEVFDGLHAQNKMYFPRGATPFGWPVFVVWKNVNGKPKGRPVVDLRVLNSLKIPDNYPMPLQQDIIDALRGASYISVMDASSFFYQFLVKEEHQERFTVISHRGQETSRVALMGYHGSPAYVQRFMDNLLKGHSHFCRCFIDDIVVFSKSQEDHIQHLRTTLTLFKEKRISLSGKKTFLGYPSVELLGHRVDGFGMSTTEERVAAMKAIQFPENLQQLERFIGMAGWLRQFVPFYAKIIEPLQKRKTELLAIGREQGATGAKRKGYVTRTKWEPNEKEIASFESVKAYLSDPRTLIHCDPARQLYLKIDASNERGFGILAFHLKEGYTVPSNLSKIASTAVQPILFLSKLLSAAEKNYRSTELEVACLLYTCRRLRVMLQSAQEPVIVLTDHAATRGVCNQTSLATNDASKANMRLIVASQYLSQYRLDIRHIPGKLNIVPDALSRLTALEASDVTNDNELDNVYAFSELNVSDDFRNALRDGYLADPHFARVLRLLGFHDSVPEGDFSPQVHGINFMIKNGLLYHVPLSGAPRLCIPDACTKALLSMVHDNQHFGFDRTYDELRGFCIPRVTKKVLDYIKFCPSCLVNNTLRTRPNGALQPIITPPIPFHTVTMDFILALPEIPAVAPWSIEGFAVFNCMMTNTCKFSKKSLLIPGHDTYGAEQWAIILIRMLFLCDWGIPRAFISDRDPKFVSDLWKAIWSTMNVKLLFTTAWHPQADGQSEIKNQNVEIAIRHQVYEFPDLPWSGGVISLQAAFNNALSRPIGCSPNEVVQGNKANTAVSLLTPEDDKIPEVIRNLRRIDAESAIVFAGNAAKEYYDSRHTPVELNVGEMVYLRLHKGYQLPGKPNRKISEQRTGPFEVKKRIGKLAYELDLPPRWKIHPVISIAHLVPAPDGDDPFERPVADPQEPIENEGDDDDWKSYELERVVDRRTTRYGGRNNTEYLVKFKGYGNQHNDWYPEELLADAQELVAEYEQKLAALPAPRRSKRTSTRRL